MESQWFQIPGTHLAVSGLSVTVDAQANHLTEHFVENEKNDC